MMKHEGSQFIFIFCACVVKRLFLETWASSLPEAN